MTNLVRDCWHKTLGKNRFILGQVLAELQPNGGGSMKDALNRIELRQQGQIARGNAARYATPEPTFLADATGKVIETNRAHRQLTGFSEEEMMGDGWVNAIYPSERLKVQAAWDKAVERKREFSEDVYYIKPTGEKYLVHVNVYRQICDEGNLYGYHGVVNLIEEQ